MVRRDQVRMHAELQHAQPVRQVVLPHRRVPLLEVLAAPDVVDEDVEPALVGADPIDELRHVAGNEMIESHRDASAAGRADERRGFFDGLGAVVLGASIARAPPRHIHDRARRPEFHCNPSPGASRRSRDQCDPVF